MSRSLRQQAHRSTEEQSEHYEYTDRIECISTVNIGLACRRHIALRVCHHMCSSVGQLIHSDDGNNQETEYDECDEYVDELVDARGAVKGDVGICCFLLSFWGAEVFLQVTC